MKKKIYLLVFVLFLIFGGLLAYYVINGQKSSINQGELSDRSREYLENKNTSEDDSELQYVELTGVPEGARGKTFTVEDCFVIQIPFVVDNERQKEGECHLYVSTTRPDGSITAFMQVGGEITNFDGVPGVSLRRMEKEKYKEMSLKVKDKTFLGFRNSKELEETYFYYTPNSFFTITFSMSGLPIEEEVKKTLESINF